MPVLEVTAAIASIIAGFVTCSKYAKDLHTRHKEKQGLAAEALRLHGLLTNSSSKLFNDWVKIEQHFKGQSTQFAELIQARKDLGLLEGKLKKSLLPAPSWSSSSNLGSYHDLASRSRDLTTGVLDRLQRQLPSTAVSAGPLALYSPSAQLEPATLLWTPEICRNAELYRGNYRQLHEVARHVQNGEWECNKCRTRISKVSAPLTGTVADMLWIGTEGMFKAHGPDGWSCIWRRVHRSCFMRPFGDEWELLKHMRAHHVHTDFGGDPTQFRLQAPADMRTDYFGIGAVIDGRELHVSSFVH